MKHYMNVSYTSDHGTMKSTEIDNVALPHVANIYR